MRLGSLAPPHLRLDDAHRPARPQVRHGPAQEIQLSLILRDAGRGAASRSDIPRNHRYQDKVETDQQHQELRRLPNRQQEQNCRDADQTEQLRRDTHPILPGSLTLPVAERIDKIPINFALING
jgi:hypothetical protein